MMAGPKPISVYTRAQAIADGALLDVSGMAWEACFRYPVAITAAVWEDVQRVPKRSREDADGRLGDLLWTAHLAAPQLAESAYVYYWLQMPLGRKRMYRAKLVLGAGDCGELVATIMRPDED